MTKNAIWEAAKEPLRLLLSALVALFLNALLEGADLGLSNAGVAILTIVLRAIDKMLHDYGKATENETLKKGLTQF